MLLEFNTSSGGAPSARDFSPTPWWTVARHEQLPPVREMPWSYWLILAGRGWGKTRTGAEWARQKVNDLPPGAHGAFVAKDPGEARDVMIEGPSGILKVCPPWDMPDYEPSKKRLSWKNGTYVTVYSSEEYEELRGPQHHFAWCDEPAKWRNVEETWEQLQFGLRLGANPQVCLTTTPRPVPMLKSLVKDALCVVTKGTTYDNMANLSPVYQSIIAKYEGTRLGRQELNAELLSDIPGALWSYAGIDQQRVMRLPEGVQAVRAVVGVDPSATESGNEAGIIGMYRGSDHRGYVIADKTKQGKPDDWAKAAVDLFIEIGADHIIAEVNNGGDMVESVINNYAKSIGRLVPVRKISASRGKVTRAEPISLLYDRGIVSHVGSFPELEDEMCTYEPVMMEKRKFSPNRMDALVWAGFDLFERDIADITQAKFHGQSAAISAPQDAVPAESQRAPGALTVVTRTASDFPSSAF